jgi:outer membrane receptor protein involved in Fe transport
MSFKNRTLSHSIIWSALLVTMSLGQVIVVQAQVLEEIIVTAQRREQNLQDVPISLQTFQGDALERQGFDTLQELTMYAPGLVIKAGSEEQGLILRGAGTQSKNFGIEQGVPTFIDGIHFGRGSQVLSGYMDIERVEVLKGPQPVFFGQNAAAGALNIETRKPSEEWEGSLTAEFGNFGKKVVEGAFGGPITDTFGIRVAAKYYRLEGFMRDVFTGDKFPQREYQTFRVSTQWNPTDNFQASMKFEYQKNDLGPRVNVIAFDKFAFVSPELRHPLRWPITGILSTNVPPVDLKVGEITRLGYKYGPTYLNPRVENDLGVAQGLPVLTEASGSTNGFVLDWTQCFKDGGLQIFQNGDALDGGRTVVAPTAAGIQPVRPTQFESCNMADEGGSKPWHAIMDLTYIFDSGIELTSKTGYSRQVFYNTPHNSGGGIMATNPRSRGEFFGQWSEEIRLSSPVGGQIEWMGGIYYQRNRMDAWSDAYRANARRSLRATRTQETSKWTSVFATMTFNFMDNRASLDVGARYTDISKEGGGQNRIAEWIVRDAITGELWQLPYGFDETDKNSGRDAASDAFLAANPGLRHGSIVGRTHITSGCQALLGATDPSGNISSTRCASNSGTFPNTIYPDGNSLNPQFVLRYRPSDDVSLYAKYATSFKSGAFDLAVSEVSIHTEDFVFGPEKYKIFEVGARGNYFDGRLAAEITLFATDITGNQVSFVDRTPGIDRNRTTNVGAQKSDGMEFTLKLAATDRLTLSSYIALLDGTILDFATAICTDDDRVVGRCIDGVADRTGQEARNAPNWQWTGNMRYELPTFLEDIQSNFDATFQGTSAYTTDRTFTNVIGYDKGYDVNLSYQFGDTDESWSVLLYGRNLIGDKPVYRAENDNTGDGLIESQLQLGTSSFASYGARLKYNF